MADSVPWWRPVTAAVVAAVTCGCTFSGINLVEDHRVDIVEPGDQSTVAPGPVTIAWTAEDIGDRRYGVFLDRPVLRPGETLKDLVDDDDAACLARADCPDEEWLSGAGVYVTDEPELTLDFLRDNRPEHDPEGRDRHSVAIVLLDGDRRDGESAWHREFYVDRSDR